MMKASILAIGIAAGGLPAHAAVMKAVYQGSFQSGFDARLFFAADLTDLTGKSVTLTFIYDTERGTRTTSADSDVIEGGPDSTSGGASPVTSVRVAIGESELRFVANRSGGVGVLPSSIASEDWSQAAATFDYIEGGFSYVGGFSAVLGAPGLPDLLDVAFDATGSGTNRFGLLQIVRTGGPSDSAVIGSFTPETVVVAPYVAPVPLPATAGLLVLGITAISALRTRRLNGGPHRAAGRR